MQRNISIGFDRCGPLRIKGILIKHGTTSINGRSWSYRLKKEYFLMERRRLDTACIQAIKAHSMRESKTKRATRTIRLSAWSDTSGHWVRNSNVSNAIEPGTCWLRVPDVKEAMQRIRILAFAGSGCSSAASMIDAVRTSKRLVWCSAVHVAENGSGRAAEQIMEAQIHRRPSATTRRCFRLSSWRLTTPGLFRIAGAVYAPVKHKGMAVCDSARVPGHEEILVLLRTVFLFLSFFCFDGRRCYSYRQRDA